jgi:SAM-dependent methyltransferase
MFRSLLARRMRRDWNERALRNARHYIADGKADWSEDEFYGSGETTVREYILNDMVNVCQRKMPLDMRVLEIGCGAGRVTHALARVFGEVHAVDISDEMIRLARQKLAGVSNVHLYRNDGKGLDVLGETVFDFAFSSCVFHHISSRRIIGNYVKDTGQRLLPGALFKFEVQGCTAMDDHAGDTWLGAPFSDSEAVAMAEECGFEARHRIGAGEERFWLWFFKKAAHHVDS